VLSMLQQAIAEADPTGKLDVSPTRGALDASDKAAGQEVLAIVTDGLGLLAKDNEVRFTFDGPADAFAVDVVKGTASSDWKDGKITVKTDGRGQAAVRLAVARPAAAKSGKLVVTSQVGQESLSREVLLQVVNVPPPSLAGTSNSAPASPAAPEQPAGSTPPPATPAKPPAGSKNTPP
jgi:hypothetical protein